MPDICRKGGGGVIILYKISESKLPHAHVSDYVCRCTMLECNDIAHMDFAHVSFRHIRNFLSCLKRDCLLVSHQNETMHQR